MAMLPSQKVLYSSQSNEFSSAYSQASVSILKGEDPDGPSLEFRS